MTIEELYEWAKALGIENYDIRIYGDDGCITYLYGSCEIDVDDARKEVLL